MANPSEEKRGDLLQKIRSLREKAEKQDGSPVEMDKVRGVLSREISNLKEKLKSLEDERSSTVEEVGRLRREREELQTDTERLRAVSLADGHEDVVGGSAGGSVATSAELGALHAELDAARNAEKLGRASRDAVEAEIAGLRKRTTDELDALRNELEASRRSHEETRRSREALNDDLKEAKSKGAELEAELRGEFDTLRAAIDGTRREKIAAEENIELLRVETGAEVEQFKLELDEGRARNASLDKEKVSAERALESLRTESDKRVKDLETRLGESSASIELLRKNLDSNRDEATRDKSARVKELEQLRSEKATLQDDATGLRAKTERDTSALEEEQRSLREASDALIKELEAVRVTVRILTEEKEAREKEITEVRKAAAKEQEEKITEVRQAAAKEQEEKIAEVRKAAAKEQEEKIAEVRQAAAKEQEEKIAEARNEWEKTSAGLERKLAAAEAQAKDRQAELERRGDDSDSRVKELRADLGKAREESDAVAAQRDATIDGMRNDLEAARKESQRILVEKQQLKGQVTDLGASLRRGIKAIDEEQDALRGLQSGWDAEIERSQGEISSLRKEKARLTSHVESLEAQGQTRASSQKEETAVRTKRQTELETKLSEAESEARLLEEELESTRSDLVAANERKSEAFEQLQKDKEVLRREAGELKEQIEKQRELQVKGSDEAKASTVQREEYERNRQEAATLRGERTALRKALDQAETAAHTATQGMKAEISEAKDRFAQLSTERDEIAAEVALLRGKSGQELQELTKAHAELQKKLETAERDREEATTLRGENTTLQKALDEAETTARAVAQGLKAEISGARDQIAQLSAERDETAAEVARLRGRTGQNLEEAGELQKRLEKAERDREEAITDREKARQAKIDMEELLRVRVREYEEGEQQRETMRIVKVALQEKVLRAKEETADLQEACDVAKKEVDEFRKGMEQLKEVVSDPDRAEGDFGDQIRVIQEDLKHMADLEKTVSNLEHEKSSLAGERESLVHRASEARQSEQKAKEELEVALRSAEEGRARLRSLEDENRRFADDFHRERQLAEEAKDAGADSEDVTENDVTMVTPKTSAMGGLPWKSPKGPYETGKASEVLSFLFNEDEKPPEVTTEILIQSVRQSVEQVKDYPAEALELTYSDVPEKYLRQHCRNVSRLAIFLAWKIGCTDEEVERIGLAGLLHDAGMMELPEEIVLKHASLTAEEHDKIKEHTELSARLAASLEGMDPRVPEIIRQHHESLDGTGYPRGLRGESIHRLAKILCLVDSFEAISAPRVYKEETLPSDSMCAVVKDVAMIQAIDLPPDLSLEELSEGNPGLAMEGVVQRESARFDADLVRGFLRHMGYYPLGSYLQMASGEIARVVATNPDAVKKPIIEIIMDPHGKKPARAIYVDLMRSETMKITKPISAPKKGGKAS